MPGSAGRTRARRRGEACCSSRRAASARARCASRFSASAAAFCAAASRFSASSAAFSAAASRFSASSAAFCAAASRFSASATARAASRRAVRAASRSRRFRRALSSASAGLGAAGSAATLTGARGGSAMTGNGSGFDGGSTCSRRPGGRLRRDRRRRLLRRLPLGELGHGRDRRWSRPDRLRLRLRLGSAHRLRFHGFDRSDLRRRLGGRRRGADRLGLCFGDAHRLRRCRLRFRVSTTRRRSVSASRRACPAPRWRRSRRGLHRAPTPPWRPSSERSRAGRPAARRRAPRCNRCAAAGISAGTRRASLARNAAPRSVTARPAGQPASAAQESSVGAAAAWRRCRRRSGPPRRNPGLANGVSSCLRRYARRDVIGGPAVQARRVQKNSGGGTELERPCFTAAAPACRRATPRSPRRCRRRTCGRCPR